MGSGGILNFKLCHCIHYLPAPGSVKVPSNVLFCDPFTSLAFELLYTMSGVQEVRTPAATPSSAGCGTLNTLLNSESRYFIFKGLQ